MNSPVFVLSPDTTRGSIVKKMLQLNGMKVAWFKNYYDAEGAWGQQAPSVVIFDAKGLLSRDAGLFARLRSHLPRSGLIILVDADVAASVDFRGITDERCVLPEPFDPELVALRVKELLASPPPMREAGEGNTAEESPREVVKESGKESLMGFLKQFLKLD
jgi:DNA-binding response OmpR family regulator